MSINDVDCSIGPYNDTALKCSTSGVYNKPITIQELNKIWNENKCPEAFELAMNTTQTDNYCKLQYNQKSSCRQQDDIKNLFNAYLQSCKIDSDSNSLECNEFQQNLINLCVNNGLPGICGYFLGGKIGEGCEGYPDIQGYCTSKSRSEVLNSKILSSLCGCYVEPDPVYLNYTLVTPDCLIGGPNCRSCNGEEQLQEEICVGNPACDPLCRSSTTSQKAYTPNGNFITCPQNICVINDVKINVVNSTINNGINFNSICGGCDTTSGCLCVISGVNVSQTMSTIGVGTLNNFCANSICLEDGATIGVPCGDFNPVNGTFPNFQSSVNIGITFLLVTLVIIILVICITVRFTHITTK